MALRPIQTDEAYIRVTRHGNRHTVEGLPHCFLSPVRSQESSGTPATIYSEWTWDGEQLLLKTDRLGFYPLFYAHGSGEILVSPSLTTLIARGASTELDDIALATFLRLKFFLGEDTPFKAIRVLPPSGYLRWTGTSAEVRGCLWSPTPQSLSRIAAMDLYAEALRDALKRHIPADGAWALPLSGGQDSRHILFTLCELGRFPETCVTARHYPPTADEDAVAAAVARALGVKHLTIGLQPYELAAELKKNVLTHHCAIEHGWMVALTEFVAGRYGGVYDGIAGDVLSAGLYQDERRLSLFHDGRLRELGELLLGSEGYLPGLLSRGAYQRLGREVALERVVKELARHVDAPNPVGSFYFWNRTRRCVASAPFGMLSRACSVLAPYLDPAVYELLASLPATMFLDHRFHADTIARAFPRYAEIPFQPKGARQTGAGRSYRRLAADLLRYSRTGSGRLARRGFITARTLRALVDPRYAPAIESFGSLAIYLLQLEEMSA
jgi:asparagine synthase (glutamine-hydrolysing)